MFCLEKGFNHLCDVTITDFTIRMGVGLKKWNSWLLCLGCNQFEFITQRVHGFVVRPLSFKVHILKETTKDMNPRLKTKSFFFVLVYVWIWAKLSNSSSTCDLVLFQSLQCCSDRIWSFVHTVLATRKHVEETEFKIYEKREDDVEWWIWERSCSKLFT
jgi:hypothetical protein